MLASLLRSLPRLLLVTGLLAAPATWAASAAAQTETFMRSGGFIAQDVGAAEDRLHQHFAAHQPGALVPGGDVTAVEQALVLLELMEPALPRTRTIVRYAMVPEDPQADRHTPHAFLTVERYNLGPALRRQLVQEHGAAQVAPARAFGTGPHVAWRFVSRPLMGASARLLALARREIPAAEAARTDCDGRPCLSLDRPVQQRHRWREHPAPGTFRSTYQASDRARLASAPRVAAELLVAAGLAAIEPDLDGGSARLQAFEPERPAAARGTQPYLFITIEHNLAQEEGTDAVLHQSLLDDDSVGQLWQRRVQTGEGLHFMRSTQARR